MFTETISPWKSYSSVKATAARRCFRFLRQVPPSLTSSPSSDAAADDVNGEGIVISVALQDTPYLPYRLYILYVMHLIDLSLIVHTL